MTPFWQHTSDGIGTTERSYHLRKARVRRRWTLNRHTPNVIHVAAYFRSEEEARLFADTFGLTITDHTEARA